MRKIKLFDPIIDQGEEIAIKKTLRSGFWASGAGTNNVLKFETKFMKYVSADSCIALNSGTAALHLALSLENIRGREVILPSLSFVTTAHAVIYNGGKPVFVDIDPDTACIDPKKIESAITDKTKVILPVHFGGMPADLDEITEICRRHKLVLIEDAAHAAGSKHNERMIGGHGDAVCFSFHPVKNLAMPTGGAITLNGKKSQQFETILKSKRWCGITDRKGVEYDVDKLGWNYYMNEFSAAIGIEQLRKLDKLNNIRRKIARRYAEEIKVGHKMQLDKNCSYHFYWIRVKNRDRFMKDMADSHIETGIHYRPIHRMKFYIKNKRSLPQTEQLAKEIVSIPIHPNLSESDVTKIISKINQFS